MALMTVYCARNNETAAECEVKDIGAGAGEIVCLECGCDGNWGKFALGIFEPDFECTASEGLNEIAEAPMSRLRNKNARLQLVCAKRNSEFAALVFAAAIFFAGFIAGYSLSEAISRRRRRHSRR